MRPIRVLIADDEPFLRRGFRSYLIEAKDIQIVGEAGSGPEAVELARKHEADVVLMDVRMPGGSGIDATRELTSGDEHAPIAVIIITTFDTDENVFGALEAGASGVLLKTAEPEELIEAVQAISRGDGYISGPLVKRIFAELNRRHDPEAPTARIVSHQLTDREVHMLHGLTLGHSNEELSETLNISIGTVKSRLISLKKKLDLDDRRHIVVWAFNNGFNLPEWAPPPIPLDDGEEVNS